YVSQVMTKPCIVVNCDLAVEHIAKLFARAKIRIAPVIKDKLLGIISITDILTKTNLLTATQVELTSQKRAELIELLQDESIEDQPDIDLDKICENWCSG
ncbi:MAG: CBS domain-containing protein, partial [Prochloraceae cyanobacterium]